MTCGEVSELAAACALGALAPLEIAEIERHLASPGFHGGCREAVEHARVTAAELAHALPEVRPPRRTRSALLARVGRPRSRRASRLGAVAWPTTAAAVALVLLQAHRLDAGRLRGDASQARAAALAATEERDRLRAALRSVESTRALGREALALLERPGARVVRMAPQPGETARAVAILDVAGGRAVVASSCMPARKGEAYQLWVLRGTGAPRPAGFMHATSDGTAAGEVDRALLRDGPPEALAVSLEPAGGRPAPTRILAVGKLAG